MGGGNLQKMFTSLVACAVSQFFCLTLKIPITALTVAQRWTARKNELVGIENSNKLPIRGDLMISLNFSIDINPQVFYILVGLYVVYKIIKLVWLLDVKNRIKW